MNFDKMVPSALSKIWEENEISASIEDPTVMIPRSTELLIIVDENVIGPEDRYDMNNYRSNPNYVGK